MNEKVQVIVATNAFGMGIDKANVKTVIHIQLPESLENYYQEAGRAGRNGKKAYAVLLTSPSDIAQAENQFIHVLP
jgi:ATP-dependent DNA helicase RecQ